MIPEHNKFVLSLVYEKNTVCSLNLILFSMFGPDADQENPDDITVSEMKRCETPLFGKNGRLIKRPPRELVIQQLTLPRILTNANRILTSFNEFSRIDTNWHKFTRICPNFPEILHIFEFHFFE